MNSKRRRAAKQRARSSQRASGDARGARDRSRVAPEDLFVRPSGRDREERRSRVAFEVELAIRRIGGSKLTDLDLAELTEGLLARVRPCPVSMVGEALGELLARVGHQIVVGGWAPGDLRELVDRNIGDRHLGLLAAVLREEARRHQRHSSGWLAGIETISTRPSPRIRTPEAVASGLQLAALLSITPTLAGEALSSIRESPLVDDVQHPRLARVRALLAKAESTEFDEEAEALSAKAQELISRYALDRLLEQGPGRDAPPAVQVRRIWLDAPYVGAKASLVHEVAMANRCKMAVTERLAYCLVIGAASDLDAVDLLVTSLLVQANRAMLRSGRQTDRAGLSRTRSFRRSFLMAYATGIGRRLSAASQAVVEDATGTLLPVVRDQDARVAEAFAALIPHSTSRTATVSNGEGWAAGLAAADLAELDVAKKVRGTPS